MESRAVFFRGSTSEGEIAPGKPIYVAISRGPTTGIILQLAWPLTFQPAPLGLALGSPEGPPRRLSTRKLPSLQRCARDAWRNPTNQEVKRRFGAKQGFFWWGRWLRNDGKKIVEENFPPNANYQRNL